MALVSYSDSENSDTEDAPPSAPATTTKPASSLTPATKPSTFQKFKTSSENSPFSSTNEKNNGPRRIRVDLPTLQPDAGQSGTGLTAASDNQPPPAKRQRTGNGGAFSNFNALLPAPKRPAVSAPKAGVSLRTSGEAVFSRRPAGLEENGLGKEGDAPTTTKSETGSGLNGEMTEDRKKEEISSEPKIVGNAMKFRPLSVANSKKKKSGAGKKVPQEAGGTHDDSGAKNLDRNGATAVATAQMDLATKEDRQSLPAVPTKAKKSLFSLGPTEDEDEDAHASTTTAEPKHTSYDPLTTSSRSIQSNPQQPQEPLTDEAPLRLTQDQPPSLATTAAELNLSASERRQLFGRNHAKSSTTASSLGTRNDSSDVKFTHFNTAAEYAANEAARQAGDVVEHRAVKTIAPGKHSLSQLVKNAREQHEGLEDKWAEGRRERGEAGSRYGWGK